MSQATYPGTVRATLNVPLFGLAPGGVYHAVACYHRRGALLPHHFTLTSRSWRYIFCCTCRRLAPPRRYLAPCPAEPGLSSRKIISQRLSGRLQDTLYLISASACRQTCAAHLCPKGRSHTCSRTSQCRLAPFASLRFNINHNKLWGIKPEEIKKTGWSPLDRSRIPRPILPCENQFSASSAQRLFCPPQ